MLCNVPREIFDIVIGELEHNDVKTLSRVSRVIHSTLASTIWKGISVNVDSDKADNWIHRLDAEPMSRCAAAFRRPTATTQHATKLTFWSDLRYAESRRQLCPHARAEELADHANGKESGLCPLEKRQLEREYDRLARAAKSIVMSLPPGQLVCFSWDVGACVPHDLIDALAKQHPCLQSLRLTTDFRCPGPLRVPPRKLDLPSFRDIRRLCWRAPSTQYLDALFKTIANNHEHLEELELDFVSRAELVHGVFSGNLKTNRTPSPLLPALRVLSLSNADLLDGDGDLAELIRAIDFSALESLTLRKCEDRGWEELLKLIVASGKAIKLKRLEIKCGEHGYDSENAISQFVGAFEGLQELLVSFSDKEGGRRRADTDNRDRPCLWRSVQQHRATLKRFVCHKRVYSAARRCCWNSHAIDYSKDSDDLGIQALENNPLDAMNLECLGLSCGPSLLLGSEILKPYTTSQPTLKLLHLRQTGSHKRQHGSLFLDLPAPTNRRRREANQVREVRHDILQDMLNEPLRRLAEWAFGPQGIPSLEIIACGDFAHGRDGDTLHNAFVCRSKDRDGDGRRAYRVFDPRDREHEHEWAGVVRPHRGFLEACPVGSIYEYDCYYY
ncbi:hypothetical protein VTK56DRAFT_5857 [Thermocarpiscus australiensis]